MTFDEYSLLFHKTQANLSAFKRLVDCDAEVIKMIEVAVEAEREACLNLIYDARHRVAGFGYESAIRAIKARGNK